MQKIRKAHIHTQESEKRPNHPGTGEFQEHELSTEWLAPSTGSYGRFTLNLPYPKEENDTIQINTITFIPSMEMYLHFGSQILPEHFTKIK